MSTHYIPRVGEEVRAFHPRMLGVVRTGRVVRVTSTGWVYVDFGALLGGIFRIPPGDVLTAA